MPTVLHGKHILLGVTGSIACFKAADLASKLTQQGALVDTILTREAARLVTPLTFQALTHRPVSTDLFDPHAETAMDHLAVARRTDLAVVCPATAHTIARLALGLADDALTTTLLAVTAPLAVAPAMDAHMFEHPTVQAHLATLRERGARIIGPVEGRMASGLVGRGRMTEVAEIIGHLRDVLGRATGDLRGRRIVVSAGATREAIDLVRFVTNRSSGKMGYALAEAARDRGARTVLVAGPTALPDPVGVELIRVRTAAEMHHAVLQACRQADALIMAAAVADYRPIAAAPQKVKKGPSTWTLEMEETPDILADVDGSLIKIGFAAETEHLVDNARRKLRAKGLHLVVANDVSAPDAGFETDDNRVAIIDPAGEVEALPLLPKYEVAWHVLNRLAVLLLPAHRMPADHFKTERE
jgi:phosphopantothenoylcysteine decarboxylase/phosphopantothenate--cysteine ligase